MPSRPSASTALSTLTTPGIFAAALYSAASSPDGGQLSPSRSPIAENADWSGLLPYPSLSA